MSKRKIHKPLVEFDEPRPRKTSSNISNTPKSETGHRVALISIALAALLAFLSYLYTATFSIEKTSKLEQLPESYALCTAEDGKVYTVAVDREKVECLLVRKDRILSTGSLDGIRQSWDAFQNELIRKFYGNEPKAKKPLQVFYTKPGSIIIPGLSDAHGHLTAYGFKMQLQLDNATSFQDILDNLEDYIRAHPEILHDPDSNLWVQGMGWDQTRWSNWRGGFPTAEDLVNRPLLVNLPISLSRVDGHALWVSPRALELTLRSLPGQTWPKEDEIIGGEIRRGKDGSPTGIFIDNAMSLIPAPPPTEEQLEQWAKLSMKDALAVGLTSAHDASSMDEGMIDVFKKLAEDGELPIRVYAMASPSLPINTPQLRDYGVNGRLDIQSVKIYTDGALGSWGAALLEPYSDAPDTLGIMRIEEKELELLVTQWSQAGWGVSVHCIGDRANKVVLDIYERLFANSTEAGARRPRIEHAQIMRLKDIKRAGDLGVIASVQPTHATSDMWYAEGRLGADRIKGAYAYQSLLQSSPKKILPLGSDFPVESIDPLLGFYAAVSRLDVRGNSPHGDGGWYPSEKLTRAQALKGLTLDAAYAAFAESNIGSLEEGKKADYVVLDQDIMDGELVKENAILNTRVLMTVLDGQIAYGGL